MKVIFCLVFLLLALGLAVPALQAADKPNILVIWGDDVGYWNISAYNQGMAMCRGSIPSAPPGSGMTASRKN
jgi:hypothetical protein